MTFIFTSHFVLFPLGVPHIIFFPNTVLACGGLRGVWGGGSRCQLNIGMSITHRRWTMALSIAPALISNKKYVFCSNIGGHKFFLKCLVLCFHQGCIYLIKNTVKTVILWNVTTIQNGYLIIIIIFLCNIFLWLAKLNFQHHYSSLLSHGPSCIILICWFGAH